MDEIAQAKAISDLEVAHDWEAVQTALEDLRAYLEQYESQAQRTIIAITDAIEALPNDF